MPSFLRAGLAPLILICSGPSAAREVPAWLLRPEAEARLAAASSPAGRSTPGACLDLAAFLLESGAEDVPALRACVEKFARDPDVRREAGRVLLLSGNTDEARRLLEGAGGDPAADLALAQADLDEGRSEAALARLDGLEARRPDWAAGAFLRGRAQSDLGRWEEAASSYERVLRLDSHFVEARFELAALYETLARPDDAWRQHARLLVADPRNRAARAELARLAPRLTRPPSELTAPARLKQHSAGLPAGLWSGPPLRLAVGTDAAGRPYPKKVVAFRASAPFALAGSDGQVLARGGAGETWTLRAAAGRAQVLNPLGAIVGRFDGTAEVRFDGDGPGSVIVNGLTYASGSVWSGKADKELRGVVRFGLRAPRRSIEIVNELPLEAYLLAVVPAEMPHDWPPEALKAQAVIARTFAAHALRSSRRHAGYDLCDEQHCQVYAGASAERAAASRAVEETLGEVLTHRGRPAHAVYSSNCGGHGRTGADAGWGDVPYWRGRPDAPGEERVFSSPAAFQAWLKGEPALYCGRSRTVAPAKSRWTRVLLPDQGARGGVGTLLAVRPVRRDASGRVTALRLEGASGSTVLTGDSRIRRFLGLGPLRSTLFTVETVRRAGSPSAFIVHGGGWGHGVGLCQSGAAGRAEAGHGHRRILEHYFPGTELGTWSGNDNERKGTLG
jgi:stage II sporulation protein D